MMCSATPSDELMAWGLGSGESTYRIWCWQKDCTLQTRC